MTVCHIRAKQQPFPKDEKRKLGYSHLGNPAVLSADDSRERVGKAGGIGANQGAGLVHMGSELEELNGKERQRCENNHEVIRNSFFPICFELLSMGYHGI